MTRIKNAKVIGSGTLADPFRVDLPNYQMTSAIAAGRVDIEVPDDETSLGALDKQKIRKKYQGQKWDNDQVGDNT